MLTDKRSITDAELAILTLLAEKPMHGYQIEQTIENRGMRDWTNIGFSSIYYLLEKMRKKYWLTRKRKVSEIGGPIKQIYEMNKNGYSVWKFAIIEALAHPKSVNSQFQIALSALPLLKRDEIISSLKNHAAELDLVITGLKLKLSSYNPSPPRHVKAMFDLSIKQIEATHQWINEFLEEYQSSN